ncbi:uncharacterized protein FSUBG_2430 [Fusarium subglutinans]|uniref:Uncharacterized protein n=1 Tax=Gibberella subglutinans TaxID=42677 RepID=A0A8H5Q9F4_GIBSU|nr:uncharacterized protein FSUBG_2430 [Fusarium subglutinans]KAF5611325.1 hypothetical protein FSUBG_2430 [Fusarium subglutinans]
MSPAPEDGLQVTLYQAPSDPHGVIITKDAIIARLMADLAQANADKEDLQARLTKQKQSETILENINDEQDARVAELEVKLRRQMKKYRDLKRERDVFDRALDRQDYEIVELKKEVSGQNKKLNDQEREIERLETQLGIWERVVDEDNASTNSDSSSTDYNLMDIASDEEEEEDIDEDTSTSSNSSSSSSTGTISIESEDEAMDDN